MLSPTTCFTASVDCSEFDVVNDGVVLTSNVGAGVVGVVGAGVVGVAVVVGFVEAVVGVVGAGTVGVVGARAAVVGVVDTDDVKPETDLFC